MNDRVSKDIIPASAPELGRGPDWLTRKRRRSRDSFNDLPLPRRGLHLWRYTDPAEFTPDSGLSGKSEPGAIETDRRPEDYPGGLVIDKADRVVTAYNPETISKQGVMIAPLSEAVESHLKLVEPHLYELVNSQTGKFEAANGALWNDGVFIYVPDNVTLEEPLCLEHLAGGTGSVQYPRLLVVVGKNSEVTLLDEYGGGSGDPDAGFAHVNGAVEIFGQEASRTRYVSLQRTAPATRFYKTHRARTDRGATMLTIALAFGGAISKENFGVVLGGPGAESRIYGLLFGTNHQHFDNHTLHHHVASRTLSDIDFKVVLRDRARSAYTGLIRIEQDAPACEAYQENRNLLLAGGTRAEAIPELEILNEDVSCSHGATIGPIDPLLVFYLNSRGIPPDQAVRLVVSGFVAPTLNQLPKDVREKIAGFVADRLEDL